MSDKIKVVIPARFGSSRLPGKPLLLINEKPIFWHVYQRVLEAGVSASNIVLATDDQKIQQRAEQLDIQSVMTSSAHVSGTDRLNEVAKIYNWDEDLLIVNVQGDEPLIPPTVIKQLISFSKLKKHYDMATIVTPINNEDDLVNPNVVKVAMGNSGRAIYFSRSPIPFNRDDNPNFVNNYYRHVGIYSYSVKSLKAFCEYHETDLEKLEKLEQLRALSHGLTIGASIVDCSNSHGIDTHEDYLSVKKIMEKKL